MNSTSEPGIVEYFPVPQAVIDIPRVRRKLTKVAAKYGFTVDPHDASTLSNSNTGQRLQVGGFGMMRAGANVGVIAILRVLDDISVEHYKHRTFAAVDLRGNPELVSQNHPCYRMFFDDRLMKYVPRTSTFVLTEHGQEALGGDNFNAQALARFAFRSKPRGLKMLQTIFLLVFFGPPLFMFLAKMIEGFLAG